MPRKLIIIIFILLGFFDTFGQNPPLLLTKCWEFKSNEIINSTIASDNANFIILPQSNSKITTLNKSGEIIWNSDFSGKLLTKPIFLKERIHFITQKEEEPNKLFLHSISLKTGLTVEEKEIKTDNPITSIILTNNSEKIFIFLNNQTFFLFEPKNENIQLIENFQTKISSNIEISNDIIYFANQDRQIIKYSISERKNTVLLSSQTQINKIFLSQNGQILIADNLGSIFLFEQATNKIKWTYRTGGNINSISEINKNFLINSFDNYNYFLTAKKGKLIWKKRMSSRSENIIYEEQPHIVSSITNSPATFFSELEKGKITNQIILEDDSNFISQPILLSNIILLPTNKALMAFDFGNCK